MTWRTLWVPIFFLADGRLGGDSAGSRKRYCRQRSLSWESGWRQSLKDGWFERKGDVFGTSLGVGMVQKPWTLKMDGCSRHTVHSLLFQFCVSHELNDGTPVSNIGMNRVSGLWESDGWYFSVFLFGTQWLSVHKLRWEHLTVQIVGFYKVDWRCSQMVLIFHVSLRPPSHSNMSKYPSQYWFGNSRAQKIWEPTYLQ